MSRSLPSYLEMQAYQYRMAQAVPRLWTRETRYQAMDGSLHEKQYRFVMDDHKQVAFVGGIGSGKTYAGCIRALRAAYGQVGHHAIPTPNLGAITAPTYPMLRDATLRVFEEVAGTAIENFARGEGLATMRNGSEIIFRSTENPDRLRGPSLSWWYGDEAAMYRDNVYKIMIGRLREGRHLGYGWLATTPRGRNWLWQRFVKRATQHHALIKAASSDNVFLDREIIDFWENEYVGDFARQELGGEFIAFEGLVYPEFDYETHIIQKHQHKVRMRYYAAVDWGFANPGCILVGALDGDDNLTIVAEEYQRQRRIDEWVSVAQQLRSLWQIERFYCDPSEPENIAKFVEGGLKAYGARNDVLFGIQQVKNRLVVSPHTNIPRLTLLSGCANTVSEFEQYTWLENKLGIQDKPVKANDHAMDSLRYLVLILDRTGKARAGVRTRSTLHD